MSIKIKNIYDFGPEVYDRITIVFDQKDERGDYYIINSSLIGDGFYIHDTLSPEQIGDHLGKLINFEDLTKELQSKLKQEIEQW